MQSIKSSRKSSDLRQSEEYGKYMESLGWVVRSGVFLKKAPLLPVFLAKFQRPSWPIDIKKLKTILKDNQAIQVSIEPNILAGESVGVACESTLQKYGFVKKSPMLPSKTIWLDLTKSEDELLREMHAKTRYNVKKYKANIRTVRGDRLTTDELMNFYKIYKDNCKKQKFWGLKFQEIESLVECFSRKAFLLSTKEAGLILLVHDKVAYYSHNASSGEGRKKYIPTGLVWEGIKLAKKLECDRFDFEGIRDERYPVTKKWSGFTRFKKGFGGEVIEYIGLFSKWRFI